MVTITVQKADRPGAELTFAAASAGGDKFPNTGKEKIYFKNADDDTAIVITAHIQTKVDGQAVVNPTLTVPFGKTFQWGPFPSSYNDADGNLNLTYDGVVGGSIGVVQTTSVP